MADELQAYLNDQQVLELDIAAGLRVTQATPVREALQMMQESRTGCVLVCAESKLVGIFTERDYLRRIVGENRSLDTPLGECFTENPVTVQTNDSVATLIRRIHEGRFRQMPVVSPDGSLAGCVSVRNVLHHIAEHFPDAVYKVAPVSKPKQSTREGA